MMRVRGTSVNALVVLLACLHMHAALCAPTGAVLGIDLGSDNCVVAIARRKGVDIVTNEASARCTPTIISVRPAIPLTARRPHKFFTAPLASHVPSLHSGCSKAPEIFTVSFPPSHVGLSSANRTDGPCLDAPAWNVHMERVLARSASRTKGDAMSRVYIPCLLPAGSKWVDTQFGSTQRYLGEAGSTQRMSNLKNTVVRGIPSPPLSSGTARH